uniref:probable cysteine--tRNA ligase, mitochondrial isoform X1 n=2 Tax=Myxine glutinosa TaxID=7769 RepID=UPI00358FDCE6
MLPCRTLFPNRLWRAWRPVSVSAGQADSGEKPRASRIPWIKPVGWPTGIVVRNSLSRDRQPLLLARPNTATWYSCGPTVYDHTHLGHACTYMRFDIIRRIMMHIFGINVVMAMVVTDIDDKIIKRSQELGVTPNTLTQRYEDDFKENMKALRVLPPSMYFRVTDHIPAILDFVKQLMQKGNAYATTRGDVYFDVSSIGQRYGRFREVLSNYISNDGEAAHEKRAAPDFALWKASRPGEPAWEAPWGAGRPGWHIECSAISSMAFGGQLDLHSGGEDLAFPHHENEVAQSEAFHGTPQWCNYFLHTGHLRLHGSEEKMSKSMKNYITVKDFLEKHSPDEFRMFCLQSKYSSQVEFGPESLQAARGVLRSISNFRDSAKAYISGIQTSTAFAEVPLWERLHETEGEVKTVLANDFNTPEALEIITRLIHDTNMVLQPHVENTSGSRSPAVIAAVLAFVERILENFGLQVSDSGDASTSDSSAVLPTVLDSLVAFRAGVRVLALAREATTSGVQEETLLFRKRLLKACDNTRDELASAGVQIKDYGDRSTWKIVDPNLRRT